MASSRHIAENACPACGGPSASRKYQIERFLLFRCRLCRTEFLVPDPEASTDEVTYWDDYKFRLYADETVRQQYEDRYESVMELVQDHDGSVMSVLDVGCGIGNFVNWAQSRGMTAHGVDVDHDAVDSARSRGLSASLFDDLADHMKPDSVDVVALWDVIEHTSEPHQLLQRAVSYLRPGGFVLIETPDVTFPMRPLLIAQRKAVEPIRWSDMLYYSDHRVYFSPRGLSTLMARSGLEIVEQLGMRSPSAKMANVFDLWAERSAGTGKLGPYLYRALDWSMRKTGMTNKLIMIGRKPDTPGDLVQRPSG